jgi:hypothetical protein
VFIKALADVYLNRKEEKNEVREEDVKEVLIKLYGTSIETNLLIIYHQPHISVL